MQPVVELPDTGVADVALGAGLLQQSAQGKDCGPPQSAVGGTGSS